MGAGVRGAVAGAGLRRRRDGAGCAGRDRQAAAGAFPRRHPPAQWPGVGADQRAVLFLLAAGVAVGVRCHRPCARIPRGSGRPALPAVPVAGRGGGRRCARSPHHLRRTRRDRGNLDRRCAAAGADRHQPAVLGHRQHQAGDQRPCDVPGGRGRTGGPPQRRTRALQPQARHRAGKPVAVRAVCRGQALRQRRLDGGRSRGGLGDPARRCARVLVDLWPGAAVLRLARAGLEEARRRVRVRRAGAGRVGGDRAAGARTHRPHHLRADRGRRGHGHGAVRPYPDLGRGLVHGALAPGQWRRRARIPRGVPGLRSGPGRACGLGHRPGATCAPDRARNPQRNRRARAVVLAGGRGAGVARMALCRGGGAVACAASFAGAGGDGVPVQYRPGVLFDLLGRADVAAGGVVRGQPAGARHRRSH